MNPYRTDPSPAKQEHPFMRVLFLAGVVSPAVPLVLSIIYTHTTLWGPLIAVWLISAMPTYVLMVEVYPNIVTRNLVLSVAWGPVAIILMLARGIKMALVRLYLWVKYGTFEAPK